MVQTPSDPAVVTRRVRWTSRADRLAAIALVAAAVSAIAGLSVPNLYRDSDAWVRQAQAADLVTLFAVVPALAFGLWHARGGSEAGRLVALAALGYLAYNYAIFGFSVAINPMTGLHIAVLGLSVWSLLFAIIGLPTPVPRRMSVRACRAVPPPPSCWPYPPCSR